MTESEPDALPKLRLPGDLDGLRRRRRSTGDVREPESPVDVDNPDVPDGGATDDLGAAPPEAETPPASRARGLAGIAGWAKRKVAAFVHELPKIFEPMRPIPEHPVLKRSGWVELAVLVPASLLIVALELLVIL